LNDVVSLAIPWLLPSSHSVSVDLALLVLRLLTGVAFIRHGLPKLKHLAQWASMLRMPQWLCALSALSMLLGGIAIIPGVLTVPSALAIAGSMAYAVVFIASHGGAFIPPEPFELPPGDYMGSLGPGEPASWEKAAMYVAICLVLITAGAGQFSVDDLLIRPLLQG
jgi:putative oxidoreductase